MCHRRGVTVTAPQLARWKREGLLDPPVLQGRGKGGGVGRHWGPETVERAILIARTVGHGDPSLKRAARVLVGGGFLIRQDGLNELLLDEVKRVRERLSVRRDFLDRPLSVEDKRQRVRESVYRRNKGKPDDVRRMLADLVIGMLNLGDRRSDSGWTALGSYLSQETVQGAIAQASSEDRADAYRDAAGLSIGG